MDSKQPIKILVVEDESVVAKNIQNRLEGLGYGVPAVVSSGEEAIRKAEEARPDLVLMDIVLKGNIDGVQAAREIYSRFNIPVVYLTAYADEGTIERAKTTEPFGYILKPFEVKELHSAIKIALHKHATEMRLKEKKKWFANALRSIGDAVIITDTEGFITFMNPAAEVLTGWKREDALGKDLREVFNIRNEEKDILIENSLKRVLKEGGPANYTILISKGLEGNLIYVSAAPIRDDKGGVAGVILVLHDISEQKTKMGVPKVQKIESSVKNTLIELVLVTPFALVREGVCRILESERDIEILAEASSHLGIIPLLEGRKPDILIIDTGLPDLDIMKILELIREKSAKTKVILLLRTLDEKFIMDAISFGIRGFLTDTSNAEQFTQAIRTVNRNEIWLETKIITRILTRLLPSKRGSPRFVKHELTQREKEIVKLILQGYTNKQISKKLFITEPTVKSHLVNIFRKLGVGSRLQLIVQLLGNSNS